MIAFGVLGQLTVANAGQPMTIPAPMLKRLLAVFLAKDGGPVQLDSLAEAVWDDGLPRTARKTVLVYIHRLRRLLGAKDSIHFDTTAGYSLRIAPGALDSAVFTELLGKATAAEAAGDVAGAAKISRAALELWRGPAFSDVRDIGVVAAAAERLDKLRLDAFERCVQRELALGRHAELVHELHVAADEHPFHEGLQGHLMLALYRCGRQAEALDVYRRAYLHLTAELGVEPSTPLRDLHQSILRSDPSLNMPKPVSGPRFLPHDVADFTGRESHLRWLDQAIAVPSTMSICALTGAAGMGKSALAVRWGHRVADRFPDGQLYINLRGYGAGSPMSPMEALSSLLRMMNVPSGAMPHQQDEAAALYRATLADKDVLILLDNARSADQVRPLLPSGPRNLVLTTSRDRLGGLIAQDGARRLFLDMLTEEEACQLLRRIIGNERANAEPLDIVALAKACGYLPLALRIAAANLADHPQWTVEAYLTELASDRLASLEVSGDPSGAVRVVFEYSYRSLDGPQRSLFRLLGFAPINDISLAAATALAGLPRKATLDVLHQLASAHLITEQAPQRFVMHDLLREYAAGLAVAEHRDDDRRSAIGRLMAWYLGHLEAAGNLLEPKALMLSPAGAPSSFANAEEAVGWISLERSNIALAAESALAHGLPAFAWQLAGRMRGYLFKQRAPHELLSLVSAGLAAAESENDLAGQGIMYLAKSQAYNILPGHQLPAIDLAQRACELFRQAGWNAALVPGLNNLSIQRIHVGQLRAAASDLEQALALCDAEDAQGLPTTLHRLGLVNLLLGNLRRAAHFLERSLELTRSTGRGTFSEATDRNNLSAVYRLQGRLDLALAEATKSLDLYENQGHRHAEAHGHLQLAHVLSDLGRHQEALASIEQTLAVFEKSDDVLSIIHARHAHGTALKNAGRLKDALTVFESAMVLARPQSNQHLATEVLIAQSDVLHQLGDRANAELLAQEAMQISENQGFRLFYGQALETMAAIHAGDGKGLNFAAMAAEVHRETGYREY